MRIFKNEKGITLIELLAALVLFGIITVLIWSFFFQALNFNDREVTKNQLQQEANIIVNTIQQLHTKYTITEFTSTSSSLYVKGKKMIGEGEITYTEETFKKEQIVYGITVRTIKPSDKTFRDSFDNPVTEFELSITLSSKQDPNVKYVTKTIFSKLAAEN